MTLVAEDFDRFYAAAHPGRRPFAWQRRLLDFVLEHGRWPDRIVAPTGAGKTSVIDVHVFVVALMGAGGGPRVPRRLSLVVDRRALVDGQFDQAREMNRVLRDAGDGVLGEVRAALVGLRTSREPDLDPLVVALLRGAAPPSRRWVDDPSAAAIICATPAMWGSRLLFRGYGTSILARPREAGLLGYDSVVVVDEAHLARQLVATARRIDTLESLATSPLAASRLQVVEASATAPRDRVASEVGVTAADVASEDGADEVLATRLLAPKPVRLVESADWPAASAAARLSLARLIADQAAQVLAAHGRTIACVVNTVPLALTVATELRRRGRTIELLVGRMRPHDVARLRDRRPGLLTLDGDPEVDVVVATQTIEVGIDADFAALVTELASGSALAQRAGRVNRVGRRPAGEVRVITPPRDRVRDAPPYLRDELAQALDWLDGRAATPVGLAPMAIADDPPPPAVLRRVVLGRPEPWDAMFLARTSDRLFAEPDLELLLADDLDRETDVAVVVRRFPTGGELSELLLLRATPPRAPECFPASIGTVRSLLRERNERDPAARAYRWRADEMDILEDADELRPGDIVVVPDTTRWFTHGVIDPAGDDTATDVLEEGRPDESSIVRIGAGMPLEDALGARTVETLLGELASIVGLHADDGHARRDAFAAALAAAGENLGDVHESARTALQMAARLLRRRLADAALEVGPPAGDGVPDWVVVADQRRRQRDEDVRQMWSGSAEPVTLAEHQHHVAERAAELAGRLGLGKDIGASLRLAGALHDEGKRDSRFQRLLGAVDHPMAGRDGPFAKSPRRTPAEFRAAVAAAGLPTGWRHEQLSAAVAWNATGRGADATSRLVTRLTGTSHGHGRTTFPHMTSALIESDDALVEGSSGLHDEGEWDVIVEVTHREHGVWGCAYLEAILRAADGQVSGEANDQA